MLFKNHFCRIPLTVFVSLACLLRLLLVTWLSIVETPLRTSTKLDLLESSRVNTAG